MSMVEKPLTIDAPLVEAVKAIEKSRRRISIVVDADGKLLGTITDGDVRRCLLAGGSLETPVEKAMNAYPITAPVESTHSYLMEAMRCANVMAIPLVSEKGHYVRLVHLLDLGAQDAFKGLTGFNDAVIMAGGEGLRLRSVVKDVPKPMVDICGVPLLERQIRRLAEAGVGRCYLSVNYMSHVIEDHFGNGAAFGLEIRYLRESEKMGTAGALSLVADIIEGPLLVMNGDIMTTSDFSHFYHYHVSQEKALTVGVVEHHVQIPFGVIKTIGENVVGIEEKPSQRFLCNAGMYALQPELLSMIPRRRYDMTDLINDCLDVGKGISVFPIHEFWTDIGTPSDLERVRGVFAQQMRESA